MEQKQGMKTHGRSIEQLREKRRQEDIVSRKQRREQVLDAKRVRMDSECEDEVDDVTESEVETATANLKKSLSSRKQALRTLRRAFGQGTLYIDLFMGIPDALTTLVGILSGSDTELQTEAVCCVTNLASGMHDHTLKVAEAAAPYLITYLSGSNTQLQEQCSWALGNIGGDSAECRELLKAQGVLAPLIKLMKSSEPSVVRTAAFALSNLARGPGDLTKEMMDANVASSLLEYIVYDEDKLDIASEVAWTLTFLTARLEYDAGLVEHGIITKLVSMVVKLAEDVDSCSIELITPILRCLGNISSGPDEYSESACQNESLLPALGKFLQAEEKHIMKKECLWVISNMTGDAKVCSVVLKNGLHESIIPLLDTAYDVRKEAAFCLCNLASQGEDTCQQLVDCGAVQHIVPLLKTSDTELVFLALSFCEMAFRQTKNATEFFEANGGMDGLEATEYSSEDSIRTMTSDLLEKYFEKDDSANAVVE